MVEWHSVEKMKIYDTKKLQQMPFSYFIATLRNPIRLFNDDSHEILNSYFMPVCSIVKTITLRCQGRPDAQLNEPKAECKSASGRPWY